MIIPPQLGIGGWAPNPRKLRPVSSKIAEAKLAEATTSMGPEILGRMCLIMVLEVEKPRAFEASTNSTSFSDMTWPRTNRATSTQVDKPTAIKICQNPFPKAKEMAITSSREGNDQITFINQLMAASVFPPK
ncbi:hypothetical protein D3C86_1377800 [compost metagenome]